MVQLRARFVWLIQYGDTLVARMILASVAGLWALLLLLPGNTFERPVYALMALLGNEYQWALAWFCYSVIMFWRIFSDTIPPKRWIIFVINGIGIVLFCGSAICIILAKVWPVPAALAADSILSLVAVWVFMRSGLNNPPGWRHD